jgi:WD40 repeat protein
MVKLPIDVRILINIYYNKYYVKKLKTAGHNITCISISPDGKNIACGVSNGNIQLFDFNSVDTYIELNSHTMQVDAISFSPTKKILVSGSFGNTIKIWDLELKKCIKTINIETDDFTIIKFLPNGLLFISGSHDGNLIMWNILGERVKDIDMKTDHNAIFTIHPNEQLILCVYEYGIYLYDMSGNSIDSIDFHTTHDIYDVMFSPDGLKIIIPSINEIYI